MIKETAHHRPDMNTKPWIEKKGSAELLRNIVRYEYPEANPASFNIPALY